MKFQAMEKAEEERITKMWDTSRCLRSFGANSPGYLKSSRLSILLCLLAGRPGLVSQARAYALSLQICFWCFCLPLSANGLVCRRASFGAALNGTTAKLQHLLLKG